MSPAGSPSAGSTQPYLASLRVYEPLSAFTGADRVHWMTYLARADRPTNEELVHAEHQGALRRTMALPVEVAPQGEHAGALVLARRRRQCARPRAPGADRITEPSRRHRPRRPLLKVLVKLRGRLLPPADAALE